MSEIDKYLSKLSEPEKAGLERVRKIIHAAVPEVEEVISWGMPGFKYKKKNIMNFAAFKDHLSLFPGAISDELRAKFKNFKTTKGTIHFTNNKPIPETLIKEILKKRVSDIDAR